MFNYTAMGLGNHDFDDGIEGLVPFIRGANFAVLASNINSTAAPELVNCSK
jgi:2',3'-cyclic-nucleotide 2'-phosphodiesterase (5'-nucleotidase family)